MTQMAWTPKMAGAFDRLAWRQALRDTGALRQLTAGEWAVFWFAYDHADGLGQVDLPQLYLAQQMGLSQASVKRALRSLATERGLLSPVRSRHRSRVNRFQLTAPAAPATAGDEAGPMRFVSDPDAGADVRLADGFTGEPLQTVRGSAVTHSMGHRRPIEGVTGDPQSRDKSRDKSSRPRKREQRDASPVLFAIPAYDAAAAAILISAGIPSRQTASALVARYRVTRQEARHIRANLRAARRAGVAVKNPVGWLRAAVQRGEVTLDPRVLALIDERRLRQRRTRTLRERVQAEQAEQEARAQAQSRRQHAERVYASLTASERQALERAVHGDAADESGRSLAITFRPSPALLRSWVIDELIKREAGNAGA